MGRITIFTKPGCRHCKRAKAAFEERGISYVEINLSDYPEKRKHMLSLSDRLTVPQIFVNENHIGGAKDTLKLLKTWDGNIIDNYKSNCERDPDPTDPRLEVPTYAPSDDTSLVSPRKNETILMPDGTLNTVLEITELLKKILPRSGLSLYLTTYKNSFTGSQLLSALKKRFKFKSKSKAAHFGRTLQKNQILDHVLGDHHILEDSENHYYRLYCDQTPQILNSYRVWTERCDPDPMRLLKRLRKMLNKILSAKTDRDGKVNYKDVANSKDFPVFEEAACELQKVDYREMPFETKLAFSINLYNIMIKYAFVKVGIANSKLARRAFFNDIKFQIGPDVFSFQDVENGILRGNRKAPYTLLPQFSKEDPRLQFSVENVDCRIHFALNCGASSCPPVRNFNKHSVDEELRIVSMAFCEDDANVRIDMDSKTVHLSKIFSWYQDDFGNSNEETLETIYTFLRNKKKKEMRNLLTTVVRSGGASINVVYNHYDWSTDASESVLFSGGTIKADITRQYSFFT
jgi:glutaredoxin